MPKPRPIYTAMDALDQYLGKCGLDESLLHLVRLRASQINGCAYCIDMHWKDLRAINETEQRLYTIGCLARVPVLQRSGTRCARLDRGGYPDHQRPRS